MHQILGIALGLGIKGNGLVPSVHRGLNSNGKNPKCVTIINIIQYYVFDRRKQNLLG